LKNVCKYIKRHFVFGEGLTELSALISCPKLSKSVMSGGVIIHFILSLNQGELFWRLGCRQEI